MIYITCIIIKITVHICAHHIDIDVSTENV